MNWTGALVSSCVAAVVVLVTVFGVVSTVVVVVTVADAKRRPSVTESGCTETDHCCAASRRAPLETVDYIVMVALATGSDSSNA